MAAYIEQFMANDDRVSADVENFQVFEHDLRELNASTIRASADEEYFHSLEKIHQDLMQLNTALDADRSKILEQIGKINRLLERYPFGARCGRLSIEPQVSKSDPQFLAALRARLADLNAYQQQGRTSLSSICVTHRASDRASATRARTQPANGDSSLNVSLPDIQPSRGSPW